MKINQLKPILKKFLIDMMEGWFSDKPFLKVIGIQLINANENKYDNIFEMFADENGDIDMENLLNSIVGTMEKDYEIDLQQFSPLLPNRILLISKNDLSNLVTVIKQVTEQEKLTMQR